MIEKVNLQAAKALRPIDKVKCSNLVKDFEKKAGSRDTSVLNIYKQLSAVKTIILCHEIYLEKNLNDLAVRESLAKYRSIAESLEKNLKNNRYTFSC